MAVAEAPSGLLFDEAQDRRLADLYAPCFTLTLQLRATREFGDAEVLRRRIKDLLDQSEKEALRTRTASHDLREAKFALVAFLDETILSSEWSQKDQWVARPLQLELYNRYDAGEAFFERLEELRAQPVPNADVLEVYYLCMALGFKGRYELYEQERLRILIEEAFGTLKSTPGMGVGKLSPHGKPRDQMATEVQSKLPVWAIAAFAGGLALLIYLGMYFYMNSAAGEAIDTIESLLRATL